MNHGSRGLASGPPGLLAHTYPVFRATAGAPGLTAYYLLAGVQVVAALVFLVTAVAARRHRAPAVVAGAASLCWVVVHYASGFGAASSPIVYRKVGGATSRPQRVFAA